MKPKVIKSVEFIDERPENVSEIEEHYMIISTRNNRVLSDQPKWIELDRMTTSILRHYLFSRDEVNELLKEYDLVEKYLAGLISDISLEKTLPFFIEMERMSPAEYNHFFVQDLPGIGPECKHEDEFLYGEDTDVCESADVYAADNPNHCGVADCPFHEKAHVFLVPVKLIIDSYEEKNKIMCLVSSSIYLWNSTTLNKRNCHETF